MKERKNYNVITIALIVGLALSDVFGQFMFKKFQTNKKNNYQTLFLLCGFISYLIYAFCIYNLVTTNKLATTGVLHTLSHFIVLGLLFGIGKLYFGEKYSTREVIGLTLGLVSIFILLSEPHGHGHGHGHSHGHSH